MNQEPKSVCCEKCACQFANFTSQCPRKFCYKGCHEGGCPCHKAPVSVPTEEQLDELARATLPDHPADGE